MRIIGGVYGGRRFQPPAGIPARPTTDLVKESLFNILQNIIDFEGIHVLDLFSGTGNISFEFASRGAEYILAIEKNKISARFITATFQKLDYQNYKVLTADVLKVLPGITQQFDVIFADPPYALPQMEAMPDMVFGNKLLKEHGVFILEHTHNIGFEQHPLCFRSRKYGGSYLSFFRNT